MPLRLKQKASTFDHPNLFISRHKREKIPPEIHFKRMIHFYFHFDERVFRDNENIPASSLNESRYRVQSELRGQQRDRNRTWTKGDAPPVIEGAARMCKDVLLQVKEKQVERGVLEPTTINTPTARHVRVCITIPVYSVYTVRGVVGRNRGGNIPKEPIVAHSAANPPHSSGQWMPTAISSSVLRMRSLLSLSLLSVCMHSPSFSDPFDLPSVSLVSSRD